jgi:hypothetical protein
MKTEFELEFPASSVRVHGHKGVVSIVGKRPEHNPYVSIATEGNDPGKGISAFIKDKDLERFAVNILKALKSKRLKAS